MKSRSLECIVFAAAAIFALSFVSHGQTVQRVTSKTFAFPFGAGSTLNIMGAPKGSITVRGNNNRTDVELTANIEINAPDAASLDRLAQVTTYAVEEGKIRTTIQTIGTHNKLGDKKFWKKFPKELIGLPFRIDYVLLVPRYMDLNVSGGVGKLEISGVEGAIKIMMVDSEAKVDLLGGAFAAAVEKGSLELNFPERSWRNGIVDTSLSAGNMTVRLPVNLSADLTAVVSTSGSIKNDLLGLTPRDRNIPFTERSLAAKVGSGGAVMKFIVGSGNINLMRAAKPN